MFESKDSGQIVSARFLCKQDGQTRNPNTTNALESEHVQDGKKSSCRRKTKLQSAEISRLRFSKFFFFKAKLLKAIFSLKFATSAHHRCTTSI